MKKIVFECGDCRRTHSVWRERGRAPKRCDGCKTKHDKRLLDSRKHRTKMKHRAFDEIVSLIEAGGLHAFDDVCRLIEKWKQEHE